MKFFIGTGSVTYAAKAKRILDGAGIKNRMSHRSDVADGGCGWGVEVTHEDAEYVVKLLYDYDLRITGISRDLQ